MFSILKIALRKLVKISLIFCGVILMLGIGLLLLETICGTLLGNEFYPNIDQPDLEVGKSFIPGVRANQISYFPIPGKPPDKWIKNRYFVRINSLGFRGEEVSPSDFSKLRIMALGDSCTFGYGENEEDIYTTLLEKILSEKTPSKVYNLGHPGYTAYQGLTIFRKMAPILRPDVVIIAFGANDGDDVKNLPPFYALPRLPDNQVFGKAISLSTMQKVKFGITKLVAVNLKDSKALHWFTKKLTLKMHKNIRTTTIKEPRLTPQECKEKLVETVLEAKKHGTISILVAMCARDNYEKAVKEAGLTTGTPVISVKELFRGHINEFAQSADYSKEAQKVREKFGVYLTDYPYLLFTNDGCHPNPLGHRIIAEEIFNKIAAISPQ